jgi:hypothetical protein
MPQLKSLATECDASVAVPAINGQIAIQMHSIFGGFDDRRIAGAFTGTLEFIAHIEPGAVTVPLL